MKRNSRVWCVVACALLAGVGFLSNVTISSAEKHSPQGTQGKTRPPSLHTHPLPRTVLTEMQTHPLPRTVLTEMQTHPLPRTVLPFRQSAFLLTSNATTLETKPGGEVSASVGAESVENQSGTLALSTDGLPATVTATFEPPTIQVNGKEGALSLAVSPQTPPGKYPFKVIGRLTGTTTEAALAMTLIVGGENPPPPAADFMLSANVSPNSNSILSPGQSVMYLVKTAPVNGFGGPISLSTQGLPAGTTAKFAQQTVTPGAVTALTVTTAQALKPNTFTFQVVGAAQINGATVAHAATLTFTVTAAGGDFTVSVEPASAQVQRKGTVSVKVLTQGQGGFSGDLELHVENSSKDYEASIDPPVVAAGRSAQMTVRLSDTAPSKLTVTVIGSAKIDGEEVNRTADLTLTVELTDEEFMLSAQPDTPTLAAGGETTISVRVQPVGSFLSPTTVIPLNLPAGVTASVTPEVLPPNGTAQIRLTASPETPAGKYTFKIQGKGLAQPRPLVRFVTASFVVAGRDEKTLLTGTVLTAEDTPQPLAGVTVFSFLNPGLRSVTDDQGRFTLDGIPNQAKQVLMIDGASVPPGGGVKYPRIPVGVEVIPNTANAVSGPIYLPKILESEEIPIQQEIPEEQIITNPRIPGFRLVIPPNTKIVGPDGTPVTKVGITAVRGDRMPRPQPEGMDLRNVPQIYLLHPYGAASTNDLKITFPNAAQAPPGQRLTIWKSFTDSSNFRVSGTGLVTPDGTQIVPENPVVQSPAKSETAKLNGIKVIPREEVPEVDLGYRDIWNWTWPSAPCTTTPPPPPDAPKIDRISVNPTQLELGQGQSAPLTVIAYLSNGATIDVTNLCTFKTFIQVDEAGIVNISPTGVVTAGFFSCSNQNCIGLFSTSIHVLLTQSPGGVQCLPENQPILQSVPISISSKALLFDAESDYSPVVAGRGGALILAGHPVILKMRFLEGEGSEVISVYGPGRPIPDYPYVGEPRLIFEGVVGSQWVNVPIPDSLFEKEFYYNIGLYTLIKQPNQTCIFSGEYSVQRFPNIKLKITPGSIGFYDPNPNDPNNLVVTTSDVVIEPQSDLGYPDGSTYWWNFGFFSILKNGKFIDPEETESFAGFCDSRDTCRGGIWRAGQKVDLKANYEAVLLAWNSNWGWSGFLGYWGYWSWKGHYFRWKWENDPCARRNDNVNYWRWSGYYNIGWYDAYARQHCDFFKGCELQLAQTPLKIGGNLIVDYSRVVTVRKEVVQPGNRVCTSGGAVSVRVAEPARLKVSVNVVRDATSGGVEIPLFDQDVLEGLTTVPVPAGLPPAQYRVRIEARRLTGGGDPEEVFASLNVQQTESLVLPVGHTFLKGVDLADGHMVNSATDFKIPGRGLSLELTRTYSNVGIVTGGPFGAGWTDNLHARLLRVQMGDCDTYLIVGGDGQGQKFRKDGNDFIPQRGYHGKLVQTPPNAEEPSGGFDFTTKEGVKYHFGAAIPMAADAPEYPTFPGNLKFVQDPNGNRLTYTYDPNTNRLKRVTDASGRFIEPTWSGAPIGGAYRVVSVTGPMDLQVNYTYDPIGNLISATRVASGNGTGDRTWSYTYSTGAAVFDNRVRHRLEKTTDPNGNVTEYRYYTDQETFGGEGILPAGCDITTGQCTILTAKYKVNCVKEIVEPPTTAAPTVTKFAYDYSDFASGGEYGGTHKAKVTDALDRVTEYVVNFSGATQEIRQPLGAVTKIKWNANDVFKDEETDAEGRKTEYVHDANGNLTEERIFALDPDFGTQQVVSSYAYETNFNRLVSRSEPAVGGGGPTTTYQINPLNGNLTAMTDAAGHVTNYTYDANGNLLTKTDSRGITTTYRYDGPGGQFGKPTTVTQQTSGGGSYAINNVYDDRSRLTSSLDSRGRLEEFVYDNLDQVIEQRITDTNGASNTSSAPVTIHFAYYANGVLQSRRIEGSNIETTYAIDAFNRVTGVSYGISGQGGQFGTSAVYDSVGNVISTTDMRAVTRIISYDDLNRPTWIRVSGGGGGPFNADGTVSRATYDLVGNKLTEQDMHGNVTEFVYDGLYRLRRKLWPTVPGGGPYQETFLYDPRGNLTRYTDANNHSTEYAHDGLSRRTLVTDAAGRVMQYEYAANDASSNPSVERNVTNGLEIRREYDGLYRVTREETRLPNVQGGGGTLAYVRTVAYNDTANTVEETDARGFTRFTQMDAFGRMYKTVRDTTGLALTTYAHYDEHGNRISTTDPAGTEDNDSNHTTTWTYDILNRMTSATYPTGITESWVRDGEGLPTEHLDLNGVRTRFTYDNLQRPLTTTMEQPISAGLSCPKIQGDVQLSSVTYFDADPLGLPNANYAVATDDAVGRKTYQGFDAAGRLLAVRDGVGTADERERVMTYDGAVMLTTTDWRAVGAPGNVTSFQYDVVNRVTRAVDPFGKNVVTQYQDGTVRVVMTDKRGIVETRQLDALGRMVSVTRTGTDATTITPVRNQYDAHSNLIETRDGVGNATRFQYDGADRQTATIRGAGSPSAATITTTYDKLGNALTVDNAHLSMAYAYDALSRRTSATDGVGRTTTYGYDNLGRMTQSTDPYNNTAAYAYDELGALISVQSPAGNVQYRYDAGRRRVLDLRSDKTVERTYDILGRMTGMNEYEPGCPEDGGGGQSRTAGASSPNGAKFDSPGQASARRPGNGADAAKFGLFNPNATPVTTQTWEYNRNDSLTRLVDAKGQTVEYDYDALQRLERKRYPFAADGGFGPVVKEFAYTYNDNNLPINVTELRVDNSTVQYLMAYDGLDRLRSETDGFGKTTQFSYLDNGLRASMIDPLGATVAYDYDELNRLKQVSSPYGGATYQYHSDDLLQKMSFPDATSPKVTCDYGYDNAGRVTSVVNKNAPANSVISSYGLAYNDATNQITLNEQNLIGGNPATETSVFSFSQGNRLTTADYQTRGYQVSYTYNSAGYRTTETATGTTAYSRNYSYGQLGRLSSVAQTGGGNAGTTTFGWDANGNLTTKTYSPESGAPQTTTFTYDIRDNLRKVVNPAGQTAGLYQYDHAARRVRQETAAGVLHSTFDGDQILTEWNGTMANVAAYVGGRGQLVARSEAGPTRTNFAYLTNHLGSTANVVNTTAAPQVSASYRYDAWGVLRQETPIGQNNNRRTFTGQQWDDESGLYCFGNGTRFMDADLGMFLQEDPVAATIDNPHTNNPYVYAWSNPIWYTDRSGLSPDEGPPVNFGAQPSPQVNFTPQNPNQPPDVYEVPNPDEIAQGYRVGIKVDLDDYDLTPANELQGYNYQEPLVQVEKPANRPGNNNFGWRNTIPTPAPQRRGYQANDTILDDPFFHIGSIDNGGIIDQTRAKIHLFQDLMEDIIGVSPRSVLHDTAKGFGNGFKELFEFGYHAVTDPVGTGGRMIDAQIKLDAAALTLLFDPYTTTQAAQAAYLRYGSLSRREQFTKNFEFAGWVASQVVIGEASGAPFARSNGPLSIAPKEIPANSPVRFATEVEEAALAEGQGSAGITNATSSLDRSIGSVNQLKTGKFIKALTSSKIGRFIFSKAKSGEIEIILSTREAERGLLGISVGNRGYTFVRNTQSYQATASNAVHEGIHSLGVGGSKKAEALARIGEALHEGRSLNPALYRQILTEIRSTPRYQSLPYRINAQSPYFRGITF